MHLMTIRMRDFTKSTCSTQSTADLILPLFSLSPIVFVSLSNKKKHHRDVRSGNFAAELKTRGWPNLQDQPLYYRILKLLVCIPCENSSEINFWMPSYKNMVTHSLWTWVMEASQSVVLALYWNTIFPTYNKPVLSHQENTLQKGGMLSSIALHSLTGILLGTLCNWFALHSGCFSMAVSQWPFLVTHASTRTFVKRHGPLLGQELHGTVNHTRVHRCSTWNPVSVMKPISGVDIACPVSGTFTARLLPQHIESNRLFKIQSSTFQTTSIFN